MHESQHSPGEIQNNVIHGNGTGISAFNRAEVEVKNNLIAGSDFAGLDARDDCRMRVEGNLFLDIQGLWEKWRALNERSRN